MIEHRLSDTERLVHDGLVFPEGPRWHDGRLWLSDMHAHRVYRFDPHGKEEPRIVVEDLGDKSSGLGFLPDGSMLVVSMIDRRVMRVDVITGESEVHADLSHLCSEFINDMVVDSYGRAYVGCRNVGGGRLGPLDSIILIEPDGFVRVAADGVQGPNGMVIDEDESMLVVAETQMGRLIRFDFADDCTLANRTVFADLPGTTFDGICLDEEGMIWAATGHAGTCLRIAPGGEVIETVYANEGDWVVACVQGGRHRKELFLLLTRTSLDYLATMGVNPELQARKDGTRLARNSSASDACTARVSSVTVEVSGAGVP